MLYGRFERIVGVILRAGIVQIRPRNAGSARAPVPPQAIVPISRGVAVSQLRASFAGKSLLMPLSEFQPSQLISEAFALSRLA